MIVKLIILVIYGDLSSAWTKQW